MYNKFKDIEKYKKSLSKKEVTMKNIVTNNNLKKVSLNNKVVQKSHRFFNKRLDKDELGVSNQFNSGRCWIFSFTNMIQRHMLKKYKIKHFNISHVYLSFWDKFEKCHTYLKRIEKTKHKPLSNRIIYNLLKYPITDGGQWSMIVNIVNKYGVIPKSAMKETYNSKNTDELNYILNLKLRHYAHEIRRKKTKSISIFQMMKTIYRLLVYFLGNPPSKIHWTYVLKKNKSKKNKSKKNKSKKNKSTKGKYGTKGKHGKSIKQNPDRKYIYNISPQDFYNKYVNFNINNYISLIHAPNKEMYKKYLIKYNTNMFNEGIETEFITIPIKGMKQLVQKSIDKHEPIWFSCDFNHANSVKHSLLFDNIYKFEDILDTSLFLDKNTALSYKQVEINHAMLMIGYHKNKNTNKITKWLVENSHGKVGSNDKGEYYMNDDWFDKFVFEIVVNKDYIDNKTKKVVNTKPIVLPMWDPFGDVASNI